MNLLRYDRPSIPKYFFSACCGAVCAYSIGSRKEAPGFISPYRPPYQRATKENKAALCVDGYIQSVHDIMSFVSR